jgi:hypothetical protein
MNMATLRASSLVVAVVIGRREVNCAKGYDLF